MEIICSNCNIKLNVPDDKIPQDQKIVVSCPRCKNKLSIKPPESEEKKPVPLVEEKTEPKPDDVDEGNDYVDEKDALDSFMETANLALVMANETRQIDKLGKSVSALGYRYVSAQNTEAAIGKMRLHHFHLVILCDGFDGIELGQNPILQYLNHLSMSIRRHIFLALIGNTFDTLDHLMAFTMSANVVINWKDIDNLTNILNNGILDNEKFYKVFLDTLSEAGKA